MPLPYLCETVLSPDGVPCTVLDTLRVDFSVAARGRKRAHTLVREAKGGEEIVTRTALGQIETVYVARQGDAIFCNIHNPDDMYVPGHADGTRWKFSELTARGCDVVETCPDKGVVVIRTPAVAQILPRAVDRPTCIRDVWGQGAHQFLYPGATLKRNGGGQIAGIAKDAFEATWEILDPHPEP